MQVHDRPRLTLIALRETYAICRLPPTSSIPTWATSSTVWSITRTQDELSIVCPESSIPSDVPCDKGWRGWRLAGSFNLTTETGVLNAVVSPLADAKISVFAVATYDTDYLWVTTENYARATEVFREHGHEVLSSEGSESPR